MKEISFHVNVSDKLTYGCRLLRKAYTSGFHVVVTAEREALEQLDELIWQFSPADFIPHCVFDKSRQARQIFTPVLLAEQPGECSGHEVLINLGVAIPSQFEDFERLIEVVSADQEELLAGRQRWKHYAGLGYALQKHDRNLSGHS